MKAASGTLVIYVFMVSLRQLATDVPVAAKTCLAVWRVRPEPHQHAHARRAHAACDVTAAAAANQSSYQNGFSVCVCVCLSRSVVPLFPFTLKQTAAGTET